MRCMLVQIRGKAVMHGRDEVGVGDRLRGTGSPRWFQGPKRRSSQREPAKSYIRHNHMMAASTKKTTRRSVIHSNFVALSGAAVPDSSPPQLLFRASVTWLTHPLPVPP